MEISSGVSHLSAHHSYKAGREAVEKALKTLGRDADFLFIFDTPDYDHNQVLKGIQSITGTIPSAGCSTAGIIVSNKIHTNSSVAVMAFHFKTTSVYVEYETGTSATSLQLAENLSKKILSHFTENVKKDYHPVMFLFNDNRLNNGLITSILSNTVSPLSPAIGSGVHGAGYCGPYVDYEIKDRSVVSVLFKAN